MEVAMAHGEIDYIALAEELDSNDREYIGVTYIRPFADVLPLLKREVHGFEATAIRSVIGAWLDVDDLEDWFGGYLLDLADGTRVEMEVRAENFEFGPDMKIVIGFRDPGFDWSSDDVPNDHPVRLYGWSSHLEEIDALLGSVAIHLAAAGAHIHETPRSVN
jgi:hypothetical protein